MVIAAGPTAGGVEWAAETRLAGGGGWVGAGGGEEGGRGEEARRGGGGCVRLAVGDDGVGDSRARRRRRCAEGEREGERFGHGEAGGNRRGLGVIRGRSGGGGTGAAARGGDEDWMCLPDDADSGPQWGVLGRTAGDLSPGSLQAQ